MRNTALFVALLTATTTIGELRAADPVPYPEGYRDWRHVKSMVIEQGHPLYDAFGGIHHLYANPEALQGYQSSRFPDGAVIVFDLLAAEPTGDNAIVEGDRKVVGVMHKDSRRWPDTGGWGFEAFVGDAQDGAPDAAAQAACFACHTAKPETDFVFSTTRR